VPITVATRVVKRSVARRGLDEIAPAGDPMKLKFEIIVEQDGDRLYGRCEALKGFHVDGATEEELLRNAFDGITAYLDSMKRHDEPLPVGCIVYETPKRSLLARALGRISPPRKIELAIAA
jgi:antitoxin HicB